MANDFDIDFEAPTRKRTRRSAESKKLVFLSNKVLDHVRINNGATGTDIAQRILEVYAGLGIKMDFKNVQRRVYDALNVLCALGIVKKEKNRIFFISLPEDSLKQI
jgi:hypothetical protein